MAFTPLNYLINVALAICLVQLSVGLSVSSYTKPSQEVGLRLKEYAAKKYPGYPHEYGFGHYYQGDILLRPAKDNRIAVTSPLKIDYWTGGIVPYVIQANFTDGEMQTLQAAFAQYAEKTCIRFIPRTTELQYVTISNRPEGCYSYVGRSPDPDYNQLNLQTPACMENVGTPVHEMMHTLGFLHEQSRPDRDLYLDFYPENLRSEYQDPIFIEVNFGKYEGPYGTSYNVPYNYKSVMHYSRLAGAASFMNPVLTNKKPFFGDFGSDAGLTEGDVKQLLARYCKK
ncbi:astacin-like [Anopheles marshallii]|uniref:astacin-like n=1 Tax=Anopheles marshallii TaxID=1521116 RepID=UPI00237B00DB|nr:astacin-like [Anopheles marshallii]